MKESLVSIIHCPACFSTSLVCELVEESGQEILEGNLVCQSCTRNYPINKGLVFLYDALSPEVLLERSAAETEDLASEDSNDRIRHIEEVSHGNAIRFLEKHITLAKTTLELGAGTGWLSSEFAMYRQVVALDMYYRAPRGLEAAKELIDTRGLFFERIIADMTSLPFQNNSFDLVFVCAALHHSSQLHKTLAEVYRVLRPGGSFVLISEPVHGLIGTKERTCIKEDLEHGFHEARYSFNQWLQALRRQGFSARAYLPENMGDILKSRGHYGRILYKLWQFLPGFIQKLATRPILTIFDGFFNVVAMKDIKG